MSGKRAELIAPIACLQLHDLGNAFRCGEALGEVEPGIDIALGNVDDLAIERRGALACRVESLFDAPKPASAAVLARSYTACVSVTVFAAIARTLAGTAASSEGSNWAIVLR